MSDQDNKGRFVKGNQSAKRDGEFKSFKHQCRQNIYDALASLHKPIGTIKEDLAKPDATRWEYVVAKAVTKNNTKFIQWLFEMGIGRPKQTVEMEEDQRLVAEIMETYEQYVKRKHQEAQE